MPKLSITEAARLYGKSRSTLYKQNKNGVLSFSAGDDGRPCIDLSEMIRVYGPVPNQYTQENELEHENTHEERAFDALLEIIKRQEKQLLQADEREAWLRERLEQSQRQLDRAQQQIQLLTDQKPTKSSRNRPWWRLW
jgi:GTPase SAR1 family protein